MFCTQCGTPFELGQNFCKHCGARVNQQPDLRTPTETPKREGPQVTTAPIEQRQHLSAKWPMIPCHIHHLENARESV